MTRAQAQRIEELEGGLRYVLDIGVPDHASCWHMREVSIKRVAFHLLGLKPGEYPCYGMSKRRLQDVLSDHPGKDEK